MEGRPTSEEQAPAPEPPATAAPLVSGVIHVFLNEHGEPIAQAADFERARYGGFSLAESQQARVKMQLARAVVRAYASPDLARGMELYDCEQLVRRLITAHECRIVQIIVGHGDRDGMTAEGRRRW